MEHPLTYQSEYAVGLDNEDLVRGFKDYKGINQVRRFAVLKSGEVYVTYWTEDRDNYDMPGRVWNPVTPDDLEWSGKFEFTGWYPMPEFIQVVYGKD